MAEHFTLFFPCPNCGARDCQLDEPNQDIHAGETYPCSECGQAVIIVALSPEMLADPSTIRWDCHFCQPGPCVLAPSNTPDESHHAPTEP